MREQAAYHRTLLLFCFAIGLSTTAIGDENSRLQGQIEAALFLSPELSGQVLTVDVEEGAVVLSGTLRATEHRQLVLDIVAGLPGVRSVNDDLNLQGNRAPDSELSAAHKTALEQWQLAHITMELRQAFSTSPALEGNDIQFSLEGNTLRLTGSVATEIERTVASQLAQRLDQVEVVDNQLEVTQQPEAVEQNFAQ